jgi:hypothetical protein
MHYHCFTNYTRRSRNCASCNAQWPDSPRSRPLLPVGEDAARDEDGKRRVRRANDDEVNDDEGEDDDLNEIKQTQAQIGRKGRKMRVSFAEEDANMDEDPPQMQSANRRSSRR